MPGELHEREDAPQQHAERKQLLAEVRQLQERHAKNDRRRDAVSCGAVEQIHDVDRKCEDKKRGVDDPDANQELQAQIAIQRPRPAHAATSRGGRSPWNTWRRSTSMRYTRADTAPAAGMT